MIIICYKDSNSKYHIRTTQSDQKELNTSKFYLSKGAFTGENQTTPPNNFDITLVIRFIPDSEEQLKHYVPAQFTYERETATYWIYSLACDAFIPYAYPSTEQNSGHFREVTVYTSAGKAIQFTRDANEASVWIGSHYVDNRTQLIDEHAPIIIQSDRTISANNVVLIAGDRNSQQVTFEIDEQYDGISFLSEATDIYLNYIPVDFEQGSSPSPYVSEPITNVRRKEPDLPTIQLMVTIPYLLTAKPGQIPFNIAVVAPGYYWQTKDSIFTVLNSQFRPQSSGEEDPVIPVVADPLAQLAAQFNALREGRDEMFAKHVGEYLAIDSTENSEEQDITEIIFDANEDEEGDV